jgi:hypothetical protein
MPPFILALLSSGLRLVANAALVKGKEFIQEKTGVDLDKATLSAEDQAKLRQFQAEHEEELLRLQLEDNKLGLEETKAFLADVADARKNQSEIQMSADAPWYTKAIQPTLAAFTVLATIVLFGLFVYWSGDITSLVDGRTEHMPRMNATQKDIIIYILGVLSAAVTQILGYYFGSSHGSAIKSKSLDKVLAQAAVGTAK